MDVIVMKHTMYSHDVRKQGKHFGQTLRSVYKQKCLKQLNNIVSTEPLFTRNQRHCKKEMFDYQFSYPLPTISSQIFVRENILGPYIRIMYECACITDHFGMKYIDRPSSRVTS